MNNVELGKTGRWRSNVWTYPGASSLGSDARRRLKDHPTVKPTAMLEDALLDLTNRGDIVVDPFLGSGSTLIAAGATIIGRMREPLKARRRACFDPLATRFSPAGFGHLCGLQAGRKRVISKVGDFELMAIERC